MLALSKELDVNIKHTYLVINRVIGDLPVAFRARADQLGIPLLAVLPYDEQLAEYDSDGRPLVELPANAAISRLVDDLAHKLLTA